MALDEASARSTMAELLPAANTERWRLTLIDGYYCGQQARPYVPRNARQEYRDLLDRAVTNWLPLVVHTISQRLIVDAFRSTVGARSDELAWRTWQANQMDGRQRQQHLETLKLGYSYCFVFPTEGLPAIVPASPLNVYAHYDDADDEWPAFALRRRGSEVVLYDDTAAHVFACEKGSDDPIPGRFLTSIEHGLGVVPCVRFRNDPDLSGSSVGEVEPLMPIQDRINDTTFSLLMAQTYAAFRQRWVTGMAVPEDPITGEQVEPFNSAINRLWVAEDPDTRFGEFGQTDLTGYLNSYESAIRSLSAIAEVPPHYLLGQVANLSAEALTAAESGLSHKVDDKQTAYGESWEQVFRLAGLAAGDEALWADQQCQVRWRNTEARSMAATADALGKLSQMLAVPPRALWELIPGVTPEMLERWTEMAGEATDPLVALAAELERQTAGPATPPAVPLPAPGG